MIGAELILTIALGTSAAADGITTQRALNRCVTCYEINPLVRGPLLWPALTGGTTGAIWATRELKKRKSKWWWVVPAVSIVGHSIAARHNIGKMGKR
jgi:hypothetical protein